MSLRPRHPDAHIERVIRAAEVLGWRVVKAAGPCAHAWGRLLCPHASREGCIVFVHSTPRVPANHARQIQNRVGSCPHRAEANQGDGP